MLNKYRTGIKLAVIVPVFLAGLLVACSGGNPVESKPIPVPYQIKNVQPSPGVSGVSPTNGRVQSSTGGGVTIDVEWQGVRNGMLAFNVVMDTHNVDLDPYDLGKLANLRDIEGKEYGPGIWNAPAGTHHRKGTLAFAAPDSILQELSGSIELRIKDVAGVKERVLRWKLG